MIIFVYIITTIKKLWRSFYLHNSKKFYTITKQDRLFLYKFMNRKIASWDSSIGNLGTIRSINKSSTFSHRTRGRFGKILNSNRKRVRDRKGRGRRDKEKL
jgi:hypothetical protein